MSQRDEVISGGKKPSNGSKERHPGITPIEFWERDFENMPFFNDIEKILEFPGINDMAGVLARGNFKSDRQRIAHVRLAHRHVIFNDDPHQYMLRNNIASQSGMSALGKLLQLQIGTNLIAPAVLREALSMKQRKEKEYVQRGSDFREERENVPREESSR